MARQIWGGSSGYEPKNDLDTSAFPKYNRSVSSSLGETRLSRYDTGLDLNEFVDLATNETWGDGFPFAPFDEVALAQAVALIGSGDDEIDLWEGRSIAATELASVSLLAGCLPDYVPVVLSAIRALGEMASRSGVDRALHPDASQVVILSGPVRRQLNVNCGIGAFGPGWRANATIGRAVRLIVRMNGVPHATAFGDPAQYSFCFGEDEEGANWTPLHVQQGYDATQSAATVHSVFKAGRSFDRASENPAAHLETTALFLRDSAGGTDWFGHDPLSVVIVVSHEWRRQFVQAGWSKDDVQSELFPLLVEHHLYGQALHLDGPESLVIIGAGGPAEATEWCLIGTAGRPCTQAIPPSTEALQ